MFWLSDVPVLSNFSCNTSNKQVFMNLIDPFVRGSTTNQCVVCTDQVVWKLIATHVTKSATFT